MICGPFVPNTLTSLRELIVQEAGRVEHGLRVLAEDLVLGQQGEVDALACDASGAAVLVFAAAPESNQGLAARVLTAHHWLKDNLAWLAEEVGDSGLRAELPPRVLVLGLEVLADTLVELRGLGVPGLAVLQFCTFSLGRRQRIGVTALHDPQHGARDLAASSAGTDPFRLPNGIVDPTDRVVAARFLDLLRKVDPRMTSTGDRFSRRLFLGGCLVAELAMTDGRLFVSFPPVDETGQEDALELTHDSCLSIVDLVLRMVLFLEVGPYLGLADSDPDPEAILDEPLIPGAVDHDGGFDPSQSRTTISGIATGEQSTAGVQAIDGPAVDRDPRSDPTIQTDADETLDDQERFSLEPIRRSVVQAQLSREEFSALGED